MKTQFFRATLYMALFAGSLNLAACKGKETETVQTAEDTIPAEGMSSVPVADTIVKNNDTIIDMSDNDNGGANATGTQVP